MKRIMISLVLLVALLSTACTQTEISQQNPKEALTNILTTHPLNYSAEYKIIHEENTKEESSILISGGEIISYDSVQISTSPGVSKAISQKSFRKDKDSLYTCAFTRYNFNNLTEKYDIFNITNNCSYPSSHMLYMELDRNWKASIRSTITKSIYVHGEEGYNITSFTSVSGLSCYALDITLRNNNKKIVCFDDNNLIVNYYTEDKYSSYLAYQPSVITEPITQKNEIQ